MTSLKTRKGYFKLEDILPLDFMQRPQAVIVESGNGTGKTHSSCELAVYAQKLKLFDRIYILEYSKKGCESVDKKIL